MTEPLTLILIFCTFLLAGMVKGGIGLGLPTVSLGLLTSALGLPAAMALMVIPSAATNIWQALAGGHMRDVLHRIWPFLLMASLTVWIGAKALTGLDHIYLTALLGGLLIIYALISLLGMRLRLSSRQAVWAGPFMGVINGILTGMTGAFVVPGVMYLQACGLSRDELIQAMGMLFLVSTLALAVALGGHGMIGAELGLLSAAALIPAAIGMLIGQKLRSSMPEPVFRKVFFTGLLLLGCYVIGSAFLPLHLS